MYVITHFAYSTYQRNCKVTHRTVFNVINNLKHHLMSFGLPLVFINIPANQTEFNDIQAIHKMHPIALTSEFRQNIIKNTSPSQNKQ